MGSARTNRTKFLGFSSSLEKTLASAHCSMLHKILILFSRQYVVDDDCLLDFQVRKLVAQLY